MAVVERLSQLSTEKRTSNLISSARERLKDEDHTVQVFGDNLIYWQNNKGTMLEFSRGTLRGKSWDKNKNFSEMIEFEVGPNTRFKDNKNKVDLKDEKALSMIEQRIEEFLPQVEMLAEG